MTKRMITAQLSVGALLLVLVALMESYTGWDTAAQRLWFDSATHEWVVSNELHARQIGRASCRERVFITV